MRASSSADSNGDSYSDEGARDDDEEESVRKVRSVDMHDDRASPLADDEDAGSGDETGFLLQLLADLTSAGDFRLA
jgi:hypothetical protein